MLCDYEETEITPANVGDLIAGDEVVPRPRTANTDDEWNASPRTGAVIVGFGRRGSVILEDTTGPAVGQRGAMSAQYLASGQYLRIRDYRQQVAARRPR